MLQRTIDIIYYSYNTGNNERNLSKVSFYKKNPVNFTAFSYDNYIGCS